MRNARPLPYGGSPWQRPSLDRDPLAPQDRPLPRTETPLDKPPSSKTETTPPNQVKLSQHLIVSNSFHSHKIFAFVGLDSVHTGRVIMDDRACTSTNALRFVVAIFRVDYLKVHSHQIVFFVSGILKHKSRQLKFPVSCVLYDQIVMLTFARYCSEKFVTDPNN